MSRSASPSTPVRSTRKRGLRAAVTSALGVLLLSAACPQAKAGDQLLLSEDPTLELTFGSALTSDYVSRGVSQSDGGPAVQGYLELGYGVVYAGTWASTVSFDGATGAEVDLSFGIRPELGAISADLGYVHYAFPGTAGADYGELYGKLELTANEILSLGAEAYFAPNFSQLAGAASFVEATATLSLLDGFSVSGGVGAQSFDEALGLESYLTWHVGVSYEWEVAALDLRYSDSSLSADGCTNLMAASACGARVFATLSVDSSWSPHSKASE